MKDEKRKLIQIYLEKYLLLKNPELKISKNKLFKCPFSVEHSDSSSNPTCKIYPSHGYKLKCLHPSHSANDGYIGDIFDVCRKHEPGMEELSDDDIGEYLINMLDIQTDDEVNKLLIQYSEAGFCLIPVQSGHKDTKDKPKGADRNKAPIQKDWQNSENKNITEWKNWIDNGLNIGLNLGKKSNVIAIDVDSQETFGKIKGKLNETLIHTSQKGFHYIYAYDPEFDDWGSFDCRKYKLDMEFKSNGTQIVIAPSSVRGERRFWNDKKIAKMTPELKEFLSSMKEAPKKTEDIEKLEDTKISGDLKGLDGCCNKTFTQLGGILSKTMPLKYVEKSLYNFNKLLDDPMQYKDIKSMMWQIKRYRNYDKKELADEILEHLKIIEQSTARDLQASLLHEKKDIEEVLKYLIDDDKVVKIGHIYRYINKTKWETDFLAVSKPLNFKVPYFDNYARFDDGAMIIIGGASGAGKSHLACNFIKHFVKQGICPNLICTEAGSKFGIISASLGLKVGDFQFKLASNSSNIELEDNTVTILDWFKPKDSDYAKTDSLYEKFNEQLVKHGGLLIVFTQLRKLENNNTKFYAEDMTEFYASLVAKYLGTPIKLADGSYGIDNINTMFQTQKIRDSKIGKQYITIPTKYNNDTREVVLRGE